MNRNTIVLINVGSFLAAGTSWPASPSYNTSLPLGVLHLASFLSRRGFNAQILDSRLFTQEEFLRTLARHVSDAALIGLSVMSSLTKEALAISAFVKKSSPHIPVVWGGVHPTLFPESTILNPLIDFVIVREGEQSILGLAEFLKGSRALEDIPNLFFKRQGAHMHTAIAADMRLEDIDIPAYEHFDLTPYMHADPQQRAFDILSSRGCHERCTFCINSIVGKNSWRTENTAQTLRNIDTVIRLYRPAEVVFVDENFFGDLTRAKTLVTELAKRRLRWSVACRANYIRSDYINDALLQFFADAGCCLLRMGIESGNQRMLNILNKKLTPAQALYAVRAIRRKNIRLLTSFMIGLPGEKTSEMWDTMKLILRVYRSAPGTEFSGPQIFRPYPGSILFKRCMEKGLREPATLDEWSDFFSRDFPVLSVENYPWLSPDELETIRRIMLCMAYLHKEFLPHWLRGAIVALHVYTRGRCIDFDYMLFKAARRAKALCHKTRLQ